ncbi:hypothetical protein FS749_000609 [Ceratobasidium sp. UAMH 11750]|nr:hypothetical protein FS749_000609 [Ceratobasidium sp. UAMH 11750]
MDRFCGYTVTLSWLHHAAKVNKFPWANGPAIEIQTAHEYYRRLQACGPLRLRDGKINEYFGFIFILGKNNSDLNSIPADQKKRLEAVFGCSPRLFIKKGDEPGYYTAVSPDGAELGITVLTGSILRANIPITPSEEEE